MSMKDEVTLKDLLPHEDYVKVSSFFKIHQPHYSFDILEQQQPLMLSSLLYELFLPCEEKSGIDLKIIEEATKLNKHIKGLETFEYQLKLLNKIPYADQAEELVKTIDSQDRYKKFLNKVTKLYLDQDIEKLHVLTVKEEFGIKSYKDVLLYKRNRNWVKEIPIIAMENPTLFAVGAGHLGGKKGVINLLRKKGYALRPLVNDIELHLKFCSYVKRIYCGTFIREINKKP